MLLFSKSKKILVNKCANVKSGLGGGILQNLKVVAPKLDFAH
jgi:hypothetical protein